MVNVAYVLVFCSGCSGWYCGPYVWFCSSRSLVVVVHVVWVVGLRVAGAGDKTTTSVPGVWDD